MRSIGNEWGTLSIHPPPGSFHGREICRPSPPLRGGGKSDARHSHLRMTKFRVTVMLTSVSAGAAVPVRHGRILKLRLSAFRFRYFFLACGDGKPGTTTCALSLLLVSCLCEWRIANSEWNPFATRYSPFARFHSSGAKARRENVSSLRATRSDAKQSRLNRRSGLLSR